MNIFTVETDTPDVEILLKNTGTALSRWEQGEKPLLNLSGSLGETNRVDERLGHLKGLWNIDSQAVILSNRPGLGAWIIRFQRVVRRLTWWYLEPIIQQIRAFQMHTTLTFDSLLHQQKVTTSHTAEITTDIALLQKRVEQLEVQLAQVEIERSVEQDVKTLH